MPTSKDAIKVFRRIVRRSTPTGGPKFIGMSATAETDLNLQAIVRQDFAGFISLASDKDKPAYKGRIRLIQAGFSIDKKFFWPAKVLQEFGPDAFEDSRMFLDHSSYLSDRKVEDFVAQVVGKPEWTSEDGGALEADVVFYSKEFYERCVLMASHGKLDQMELSIHASCDYVIDEDSGTFSMLAIHPSPGNSVDFVWKGRAGGKMLALQSLDHPNDALEKREKERLAMAKTIEELQAENASIKQELDAANKSLQEAQKREKVAAAGAKVRAALDASKLGASAKALVARRFENAETADGVEDEIVAMELAITESVNMAGQQLNLGRTGGTSDPDAKTISDRLRDTFIRQHLASGKSKVEAEKMADIMLGSIAR